MTRQRLFAISVCVVVVSGCEPAGTAFRGVVTTVDTVNGVEWVRNAGQPEKWTLQPLFRVGSVEGESEGFGRLFSIVADADGRAYVGDEMLNEIDVFDSTGARVRTIGREGAGPGEFGRLYSLAWLGDTLVTMDARNARLGLLSPQGDWYGHWQHQPLTGPPQVIKFYRAGKSDFYVRRLISIEDSVASVFVRFGPGGERDTVPLLASNMPEFPESGRYTCEGGGGIGFFNTPYHPTVVQTFAPGGYRVAARTDAYEIVFLDLTGDSVRVVGHDRDPILVENSEWHDALAEYREFREQWGSRGAKCEPRGDPSRPAQKPMLRHLFFDVDGRMWVEVVANDGFAFDVFESSGRLVATLPAPERDEQVEPYVHGDHLYVVSRDSLGVQYAEAYRIVRR